MTKVRSAMVTPAMVTATALPAPLVHASRSVAVPKLTDDLSGSTTAIAAPCP